MITNKDLKLCNEQIFSYSAAYQVPFYGREKAIRQMQEHIENLKQGEVIIVSKPLGTGKTFLVNHLINQRKLDVPVGASFLTVRGIAERPEVLDEFPADILIVDEADIKTPIKKLIKGLECLADHLERKNRRAILLGDFSLNNDNISGCLKNKVLLTEFEEIDRAFLKGVLEQRFNHFLSLDDFQIEEVMEPELLDYMTPEWMRPVNNFRGMFSLMQQIVADEKYVRYNSERAFLKVGMFHDFLCKDDNQDLDDNQNRFLDLLRERLKQEFPKGNGITRGFTTEFLYEIANTGGISIKKQEFIEDILEPFAAANLLVSVGIPRYGDGSSVFVRRPEPYLPSLTLLLSVS